MQTLVKPPVWFWIVATLLALWGVAGFGGFVAERMMTPAMLARMSEYDRQLRANQPEWTVWAYGVATATGLAGSGALLAKRRVAVPLYVVSLIAVVLLFGYMLSATDLIAVKGFVGAAGLPIVIFVLCLVEIRLARLAIARGWIG